MNFLFIALIPIILLCSIIQVIENKTENKKTFTELQEIIDNSVDGKVVLISEYAFDPKIDKPGGIIIKKPLEMDGNAFYIDGLNQTKYFKFIILKFL